MKLGYIFSNYIQVSATTKKGTEIAAYNLLQGLINNKKNNLELVAFASGNSLLPVKTISVNHLSSTEDKTIGKDNHHFFESALLSKAFSLQDRFDLYHAHIGNGEAVLPFAPFVRKPILVTIHGNLYKSYLKKFFSNFKEVNNVFFVSMSQAQRKPLPDLNYIRTIYNGINTQRFGFNQTADRYIVWAGRGIPDKGLEETIEVISKTGFCGKTFILTQEKYLDWMNEVLKKKSAKTEVELNLDQVDLVKHLQSAKIFLSPVRWEEPFGMAMVEAMACGTPVVAYARGSVPEIIKDGETGFIINPSSNDIRGNWIVKKTGIDGLCEAVERIYSMPEDQYRKMRKACREHVEKNFTIEKMVKEYIEVYYAINQRHLKKF